MLLCLLDANLTGLLCNLAVALWVKTYSLYVAALQRLTASKRQTTGLNFDPNVVAVFVSDSHDARNCNLAELRNECVWLCLVGAWDWKVSRLARVQQQQQQQHGAFWKFFPLCVGRGLQLLHHQAPCILWCGAKCHGGSNFAGFQTDITSSLRAKASV